MVIDEFEYWEQEFPDLWFKNIVHEVKSLFVLFASNACG